MSGRTKLARILGDIRVRDIKHVIVGIGGFKTRVSIPPSTSERPRRITRLLFLWPLAGVVVLLFAFIKYTLLDDTLIYWIGAAPCLFIYVLINVAWRRMQSVEDVWSFFPRAYWLGVGCLFVPMLLLVNGALDRSPVELHRETVTRTILEHGRHGNINYYLELTSWRPHHSPEKTSVSERKYLDFKPGDPVIVETRAGALGIPLVVSVHWPN